MEPFFIIAYFLAFGFALLAAAVFLAAGAAFFAVALVAIFLYFLAPANGVELSPLIDVDSLSMLRQI